MGSVEDGYFDKRVVAGSALGVAQIGRATCRRRLISCGIDTESTLIHG